MKDAAHASIGIQIGVSAATCTVTVEECDNFTPSNSTAIPFKVYKEETAGGDTLGSKVDVESTGFTINGNDNIMYWIEIDAEDLSEDYPCLRVVFSDPSASVLASAEVILSGLCFQGDQTRTQIA